MALRSTVLIGMAPIVLALVAVGCVAPSGGARPVSEPAPPPTAQPAPPSASPDQEPGATIGAPSPGVDACGAAKLGDYRNQLPSTETMARIRETVGHDRIRAIHPGDAVTMDFRDDRLNVDIDENGRIKLFRCG
jgi:hypothetical protein